MNHRIHHLALRAPNPTVTEHFYVGVLGMRVVARNDARHSVWLDASGAIVMIERAESGEPAIPQGSMDLIAFAVDDLSSWRQSLLAAGVAIEDETSHTLYVRDPDGRRLGLSTYAFTP